MRRNTDKAMEKDEKTKSVHKTLHRTLNGLFQSF